MLLLEFYGLMDGHGCGVDASEVHFLTSSSCLSGSAIAIVGVVLLSLSSFQDHLISLLFSEINSEVVTFYFCVSVLFIAFYYVHAVHTFIFLIFSSFILECTGRERELLLLIIIVA